MTASVRSLTITGDFTGFEFYDFVFLKLREVGITVKEQYGNYGPEAQIMLFVENPHEAAKHLQDLDSNRFTVRVNDDPKNGRKRERLHDTKRGVA